MLMDKLLPFFQSTYNQQIPVHPELHIKSRKWHAVHPLRILEIGGAGILGQDSQYRLALLLRILV